MDSHARTPSEVLLATLDAQEVFFRRPMPQSLISDEDLESWCPPIGKGVVEEEEEQFANAAAVALGRLSLGPAGGRGRIPTSPLALVDSEMEAMIAHQLLCNSPPTSYDSNNSSATSTPGSSHSLSSSTFSSGPATPSSASSVSGQRRFSPTNNFADAFHACIAAKRGVSPTNLHLPTASSSRASSPSSPSSSPSNPARLPLSSRRGLLKNNFGGIDVTGRRVKDDNDHLDDRITPSFRPRSSYGFAF